MSRRWSWRSCWPRSWRRSGSVRAALVLALTTLAACEEAPPAATLGEVPVQFVGAWDESVSVCGQGGPNAVTVTPTEVVMEDTRVQVAGVAPDGDKAARIDGRFTGPGREWDGSVRLELSDGGRELSVVNGSTIVPRLRCP
jgi:hypothetical protein